MKDITVRLRVDRETRDLIDKERGSLTLSEYIRRLIMSEDIGREVPKEIIKEEWQGPHFKDIKLNKQVNDAKRDYI